MKRTFIFVFTLLLGISLVGCGANEQDNSNSQTGSNSSDVDDLEKEKGFIASIKDPKEPDEDDAYAEYYYMLVIPNIEDTNISDKTKDELESLAQENEGAYYDVHPDLYDEVELDTGTEINVYWNGSEGESDPPVREAEKIDVISE